MKRMIEDANIVGDLSKEEANKFVKDLIVKVEKVKQRAAGGIFIPTAQSNAYSDVFMDAQKKAATGSGISWHFMTGGKERKKKMRSS